MKRWININQLPGKRSVYASLLLISTVAVCNLACAEMREWTSVNDERFDGEFISVIGDKVVLRDEEGKQRKIPKNQFCKEDLLFIELARPPVLNISFSKKSSQFIYPQKEKTYAAWQLPSAYDYVFSAKLKKTSSGNYNHELHVEFFAIGEEIDGDNYVLLDRKEGTFVPSQYEDDFFELSGRTVRIITFEFDPNNTADGKRGLKYGGYLIVVTDSRGKIIAHESPYPWLFERMETLKKLPVGKHFDKTCKRVFPPRPKHGFQRRT